ncbi:hypothetical protein C8A00DRAFT_34310 [Chaetomidium leptoderma]|uniref:Uncharacterized protein n=1 Tax=Chaetomidium leptoderma TaxID=669021 RepID=A0AAN6ZWK7_9PEZI|nr:hypothetical protein C8A00DRAFT_34310 [Chaetomidium leptoderma]
MKLSPIIGFMVAIASGALGSPAPMVTPGPRAPAATCADYTTTTAYAYRPCPLFCVQPDSSVCPKVYCPMVIRSCAAGETLTTPPLPAPTTVVGTVTEGCTVTVKADVGCAICGCLGCPKCVAKTKTA